MIATNMIARGLDFPDCEVVVNFDVPTLKVKGESHGDYITYLHRIGRAGRFGAKGIALTLIDSDCEKECFG